MALLRMSPTYLDRYVASFVSANTNSEIESTAKLLTWGADEHLLLLAVTIFWLATKSSQIAVPSRRLASHLLCTTIATTILPHIIKGVVDQERPDREAFAAHRKGIPLSGKRNDAFPSGHAMHMGALASAATLFPKLVRNAVWGIAAVLSATRVVLLAHWLSDVLVGLSVGAGIERLLRRVTRPPAISRTNISSLAKTK